jgi:hypothetical protein
MWETDTEKEKRRTVYSFVKSGYYELSDENIFSDL